MIVLKGEHITLRNHRMSDADDIYRNINDPRICKMIYGLPWPYKKKHAKDFLKTWVGRREKKPCAIRFAIVLNETKEVIGCINLHSINWQHKRAETGTWLGVNHWGKGYNIESKKLLLNYAFKKLKLHKIILGTLSKNKRSQKAIKKLGAKKEAILKDHMFIEGKYYDSITYRILKKEWKPSKVK
ncbi:MAG: GNAT family protein [Nanoarchaeota archaeon]|nr:GNAT family protein [Nanoarchaeota archaeon]